MNKNYLIFIVVLLFSCGKKETPINRNNVKDVLTQYGKANPENEVIIKTKFGTMRIRLYEDTPLHRANFIKLIKEGHYENADFYRIVYEFMIQGGNVLTQPDYTIPSEIKHIHKKGALSMARMDDNNPHMESSAAEFFIIHGSRYLPEDLELEAENLGLQLTPEQKEDYLKQGGYMALDEKYTVFGEVVDGFEAIDKIANQKVFNEDRPLQKIPFEITVVTR
jgi:cyclophilin family peptidyl-prolyl cis-trans isomerase